MPQTNSPPAGKNSAPAGAKPPKGPPEERFWQRYSPHHEFPLSTVSSIVLHGLLLALVAVIFTKLLWREGDNDPLSLDAIQVDAGGGGNPEGVGDARGDGVIPTKQEAADAQQKQNVVTPDQVAKNDKLEKPTPEAPKIDVPTDPDRVISDAAGPPIENFLALKESAQKNRISGKVAGKGKGGTGSGGGQGSGTGTGTGSGIGEGTQKKISVRQRRMQRWVMGFETRDGGDYRDQLMGLGAILAVPLEGSHDKYTYRIYRDLSKTPIHGHPEDIRKINRIFWVDDDPNSVGRLAEALGIRRPRFIAAFFPMALEKDLREQERQESRDAPEDDIEETHFKVVQEGGGYAAKVSEVKMKR